MIDVTGNLGSLLYLLLPLLAPFVGDTSCGCGVSIPLPLLMGNIGVGVMKVDAAKNT